jgi:hypothetical protein
MFTTEGTPVGYVDHCGRVLMSRALCLSHCFFPLAISIVPKAHSNLRHSATFDYKMIYAKSLKYRYVDGTPTPAKIQISHFLKVGQFYIDVYSI